MGEDAPFYVVRATDKDISEIAEVNYESFPEWAQQLFLGCRSRQDLPKLVRKYQNQLHNDRSLVWNKVIDKKSGKIIAASGWNVFVNGAPVDDGDDGLSEWAKSEAPDWVDVSEREKTVALLQSMFEMRTKTMHGPYMCTNLASHRPTGDDGPLTSNLDLYVLFTHPSYQRRGAASLMMEWGCNVADVLDLPIWVEASDEGVLLYERAGFRLHPNINTEDDAGTNMIRHPGGAKLAGGRPT